MSRITLSILFVFTSLSGCVIQVPSQDTAPREASRSESSSVVSKREVSRSDSSLEVPQPERLKHTHTGWIHRGCVEFRDPEEIVSKGPINKVEVAHGGFIYGIRLYYGRYDQGLFHLGPGVNELERYGIRRDVWTVPEGETIIGIEGEIAGNYISRLKFVTDGPVGNNTSPQFGKVSGRGFVVNEPRSGGLRTISGHVNKRSHEAQTIRRAVTSMTFHFGAPCYIKDIKYDLAALEAASLKAVPERLAQQEIPNRTSVEQTVVYTDTKTITTTKILTFKAAFGLKIESEISAGLPGIVDTKTSFELSASTEFGKEYKKTSTQEVSWSVPVRVPPGKKIVAVSTVKRYQATVPFTYTVCWYWGTRDNILKEVTLPGVYEGIHVEDLKHDFREASLD